MLINCRLSDLCSSKAVLSLAERSKKRLSELLFRVRMTLVLHPRTNSLKSFVVLAWLDQLGEESTIALSVLFAPENSAALLGRKNAVLGNNLRRVRRRDEELPGSY